MFKLVRCFAVDTQQGNNQSCNIARQGPSIPTAETNRKLKKAKNPSPNNVQATKNRSPHVPVEQLKILVKIRPPRRAIDSLQEVMMMTRTMRM